MREQTTKYLLPEGWKQKIRVETVQDEDSAPITYDVVEIVPDANNPISNIVISRTADKGLLKTCEILEYEAPDQPIHKCDISGVDAYYYVDFQKNSMPVRIRMVFDDPMDGYRTYTDVEVNNWDDGLAEPYVIDFLFDFYAYGGVVEVKRASLDEMKAEAILRMKSIGLDQKYIDDFEKDYAINVFHCDGNTAEVISEQEDNMIADFERVCSKLVWSVIRDYDDDEGEVWDYYHLLYVSSNPDYWEAERSELKELEPIVYLAIMPEMTKWRWYSYTKVKISVNNGKITLL